MPQVYEKSKAKIRTFFHFKFYILTKRIYFPLHLKKIYYCSIKSKEQASEPSSASFFRRMRET